MEEVGQEVTRLFDQSTSDSLAALVQVSIERAGELTAHFDRVVGADNTHEHVQQMRDRMAVIIQSLGETASGVARLDEGVQQLLEGWGLGAIPTTPSSAREDTSDISPSAQPSTPEAPSEADLREQDARRRHVALHQVLYSQHPWLQPKRFREYPQISAYVQQEATSGNIVAILRRIDEAVDQQPINPLLISAELAAAGVLSAGSKAEEKLFKQAQENPKVKASARLALQKQLDTLFLNKGQPLPSPITAGLGLDAQELPKHLTNPDAIPDPPLDVLVLATDVATRNEYSVIPLKKSPGEVKTDREGQELQYLRVHRNALDTRERARLRALEEAGAYNTDFRDVAHVTHALQAHLGHHYKVDVSNPEVLSFLAECRIAERMGYPTENASLMQSLTTRVNRAWARLTPNQAAQLTPLYKKLVGL
jgi:hypothetical protein